MRSLIIMKVDRKLLDADGYRLNIGIVIANGHGDVLWARRVRQGRHPWRNAQERLA